MKSNDLSAVAQGMIIMSRKVPKLTLVLQRLTRDKRGAVTMIYALLILTMIMALGVGMDGSNALQVKYRLDLAADAASVACGEAWQNEMAAGAAGTLTFAKLEESANTTAQTQAKSTFLAQAGQLGRLSGVTTPTVTTNDGSSPITNGASVNCIVSYTATTPTYLMQVAGFRSLSVGGASSTTVNLSPYVSVYFILDTSASMMVGSTPADQSKIANFVAQYDTKHTGTASLLQGGDDPPCAFACHDETPFKVSDMQVGETNASNPTSMNGAGATTRFDVMRLALVNDPPPTNGDPAPNPSYCNSTAGTGQAVCNPSLSKGLLPYLRDTYTVPNARANLNTFVYSMYGFNEGINGDLPTYPVFDVTDNSQYVVKKTADLFTLATGVNTLTIGFNTHLNPPVNKGHQAVLPNLANNIIPTEAANPLPGTTTENPIIFVIIVTDGMNSDRNWNWNHATTGDPVPAGVTQETTSANTNTTTYCGLWKGASPQFSDGTPWWLGVNDECNNAGYSAGYWSNANTPIYSNNPSKLKTLPPTNVGASIYYASAIDTTYCDTMKANGATIAVLETPYVPLNGQDPATYTYENGVQQIIWPAGNPMTHSYPLLNGNTNNPMSALSQKLQACATSNTYYFQATDDSSIATGFVQLFNTFVGQWVHITN